MRWIGCLIASVVAIASFATPLIAADIPQDRGLFMTPPRQYVNVSAGKPTGQTFTVGNATDTSMRVKFSVEEFSVADYTYDYRFNAPPKDNWVSLQTTEAELGAKNSRKFGYSIMPPADAEPGGHYFSIFATAALDSGREIRTAIVLYVAVGGELVRSSEIVRASLPSLWVAGDIPLTLDVKNSGNVHFFIYTTAHVAGWLTDTAIAEATHILLPRTTRTVRAAIPPPILPGLYTVTYGYKTEDGQSQRQVKVLLYLPLWFFALIAGAVWFGVAFYRRRKRLLS